ncbi:MAG: MBOAT family protein [Oscillospiraceae bacterium]|nr:MBOAT family protein [Oscillospiraceae bacterium]
MVFSDTIFLFFFLPAVILCVKLCPRRFRNAALLLFSLLFYAWGEPIRVFLMLGVIVFNYLAGRSMERCPAATEGRTRRIVLAVAVAVNLAVLFCFKYVGGFFGLVGAAAGRPVSIPEIVLPIGISFYLLRSLSYMIDVYRGSAAPQRNILTFGAYVSFFPQLIAGPIVRYSDFKRELVSREETAALFSRGAERFIYGLGKKELLADQLGILADRLLLGETGTGSAWAGILAYALQIYFDFSGYSDMAIGLGNLFGFHCRENFDYPYLADSVTDFWRRWHISLSSWFREYVYNPLGGSRKGTGRTCLHLLIVWTLTGLWHGASVNFVLWGLYYAVLLALEKLFLRPGEEKLPGALRRLLTLLIVVFGWGLFYFADPGQWARFVGRLFGRGPDSAEALLYVRSYAAVFTAGCLGATRLPRKAIERLRMGRFAWLEIVFLAAVFLLCTASLVRDGCDPFIYFRF